MIFNKTNVENLIVGDIVQVDDDDFRLVTKVKRNVIYNEYEENSRYEIFTLFLNSKPYELLRGCTVTRVREW